MCINIWPLRHYEEHTEADGRYVLIFDSLAPGEYLAVELLSVNVDAPALVTVRSTECVAQQITMFPQPVVSNAARITLTILLALGLAAAVYLAIVVIQFLVLRTPLGR
jgi:hypothetical protein